MPGGTNGAWNPPAAPSPNALCLAHVIVCVCTRDQGAGERFGAGKIFGATISDTPGPGNYSHGATTTLAPGALKVRFFSPYVALACLYFCFVFSHWISFNPDPLLA